MRDLIILLIHLIATLARLTGPGGLRSVVAESLLVKHQLLILNRSRHRSPNLARRIGYYLNAWRIPAKNTPHVTVSTTRNP